MKLFRAFCAALILCASSHGAMAQIVGPGVNPTLSNASLPSARTNLLGSGATVDVTSRQFGAVCDGTTNDSTAIQSAITTYAGIAPVLIPNTGNPCLVSATISVPSNSHIIIDGTVKLAAAANIDVFKIATSAANVTFEGSGTIDGNSSNQTGGTSGGIDSISASNVTIRDLTIKNTRNWPVNIVGTNTCYLGNLTLINGGNSVEFAAGSTNCWAYGLHISTITDHGFAFYGGVTHSGIIGGSVSGATGHGVVVLDDSAQTAASHDITISGVSVSGSTGHGIGVESDNSEPANYNIVISGNTLTGNGLGSTGAGGVLVDFGINVSITGNVISDDGSQSSGATGIKMLGTNNLISVKNNQIYNEGQGSTSGVGILLSSTCSRCEFEQNAIWDDQGSPTTAFGFSGTAGSNNSFVNNTGGGTIGHFYNVTFVASDNVIIPSGSADANALVAAANAGSTTVRNTNNLVELISAGISTYTLVLPGTSAAPFQQRISIACTGAIATLTITPGTGATANGMPATCAANTGFTIQYFNNQSAWQRVN